MPSGHGSDGVVATLGDAAKTLDRIRDMGVTIALDDFGTAHSTLARLVALPVDALKIDRSFVIPMLEDEMRRDVVRSTIQLARRAGLWVVAEGVETAEHLRCLGELGADSAQGFWLARPMPAAQMTDWIERQTPSAPTRLLRSEGTPRPQRVLPQRLGALSSRRLAQPLL
jgi:EAL domain-containing protein (putative c-di-GMP-specific phosphodiesterase class I)